MDVSGVGEASAGGSHPLRFEGLKLAVALLHERREECPGATPILAVHDEIVVECDEGPPKTSRRG
jgi:hypothetical protein